MAVGLQKKCIDSAPTTFPRGRDVFKMLRPSVCMCLSFNSPTKCNSFGNSPLRAFKTRFPPALHAVTGLYVFLDNAASAFLLYDPEKNLH